MSFPITTQARKLLRGALADLTKAQEAIMVVAPMVVSKVAHEPLVSSLPLAAFSEGIRICPLMGIACPVDAKESAKHLRRSLLAATRRLEALAESEESPDEDRSHPGDIRPIGCDGGAAEAG